MPFPSRCALAARIVRVLLLCLNTPRRAGKCLMQREQSAALSRPVSRCIETTPNAESEPRRIAQVVGNAKVSRSGRGGGERVGGTPLSKPIRICRPPCSRWALEKWEGVRGRVSS